MPIDMSSGLPEERDFIVAKCPDVPMWSENLLFAIYDPSADLAMWLHLGTVPGKWTMWEDRVLVMLPGRDGALSLRAYHHTAPERRPAGPGLEFRQREPWRRWHVSFDGFGLHTPEAEMLAGVSRDGPTQPFAVDLDIECVTPAWDARTASRLASGAGDMESQNWASEHYEQLVRATGTVTLAAGTRRRSTGYGWRDHSRGPRHTTSLEGWGGHVILGCVYPESGRAWGLSRYYTAQGSHHARRRLRVRRRKVRAREGRHRAPAARAALSRRGAPRRARVVRRCCSSRAWSATARCGRRCSAALPSARTWPGPA